MTTYSQVLVDFVRKEAGSEKPLDGFKIVVDAGNGAGGFYVDNVLKPLGADTNGSQFLEPDGYFPNHIPNPENPVAMQFICDKVKAVGADFGIIFDTDVDRAGAVDDLGEEINRNKLIALISAILLEEKGGAYIVTDSITSDGLKQFIEAKGGVHHRFKRGYKNVINEAIRLNKEGKYCPLAIETSGHAALQENYFLDDGAYLVTRLLVKMAKLKDSGKKLRDLIADLKLPVESKEIRMGFKDGVDFKVYGKAVLDGLKQYAETNGWTLAPSNYEGIRISFGNGDGNGWFLLRMSLHDPIMPLNVESDIKGGNKIIAIKLYNFLKGYGDLVIDNLEKFINE
jgi:phosphomannomutase